MPVFLKLASFPRGLTARNAWPIGGPFTIGGVSQDAPGHLMDVFVRGTFASGQKFTANFNQFILEIVMHAGLACIMGIALGPICNDLT